MHTLFDFVTYTKSVEYGIAVAFLLAFVVFWKYINAAPASVPQSADAVSPARRLADFVAGFLVPEHLFFHPGHAWVRADDGDVLTLGVDDFAQKLVGKIDGVRLPRVGQRLAHGERAWELTAGGQQFAMLAPVSGEIVAANTAADAAPDIVNRDPFGDGWLLRVRVPRKTAALGGLLSGELAKRWIEQAGARLLAQPNGSLGAVAADAGPARVGLARAFDDAGWGDIVRAAFLTDEDGDETRTNA
jgi:glycine cleavage system H protein